jgi:hypothetical protein
VLKRVDGDFERLDLRCRDARTAWFVRRLWNGEVGAEIPPPLN